jgi:hypothetical protein
MDGRPHVHPRENIRFRQCAVYLGGEPPILDSPNVRKKPEPQKILFAKVARANAEAH